jgi:hypothetical protein
MSRLKQSTGAVGAIAFLVCSCSTPTSKNQLNSKAMQLQRAQFIEFAISDWKTSSGTFCSQSIYDPMVLGRLRSWIRQHAWPPIDPNNTGAVAPRGYFTVFEGASTASTAFRIYVFGSTGRAKPMNVHVSNEDWQTLLTLISDTR